MTANILLVRYGEVHLKGNNRPYFISSLLNKIKQAVRPLGGRAWFSDSRIYVKADDLNACALRVKDVFGVHSVSPAIETGKDLAQIQQAAVALMQGKTGTFKVAARRSDKTFALTSPDLAKEVGGAVLMACPGLAVNLTAPDHALEVEVRDLTYLCVDKLPAVGGMPIGTGGKAMLLLSGGIDSPVAGYMVAKRGVMLEAVHFFSHPYTSEHAKQKVIDLYTILARYCGNLRLHVVPFTNIQMEIYEKCPMEELTIIMRRFMMRLSQALAQANNCTALVTGESIGQVASQTMQGLICTDSVVAMPVFRPLIGFDKSEIIERAQAIGTFETSILPYEDCCTIFTPKHPVTKPKLWRMERSEQALDAQGLINEAVAGTTILDVTSEGLLRGD